MIGKTIRIYSIKLTQPQVEALKHADAVKWQSHYADSCDFEGEPEQGFLEKTKFTFERAKAEIAAARASTLEGDNLTLVAGSKLEGDVIDGLEVLTKGLNAIIIGEPRCQAVRALVANIRNASAANSDTAHDDSILEHRRLLPEYP